MFVLVLKVVLIIISLSHCIVQGIYRRPALLCVFD